MNNFRNFALWIIIGLLLMALFNVFQSPGQRTASNDISYTTLLAEVDSGNVREVTVTGDTISGSDGGKVIVLEGRIQSSLMPPKRPKGENAKTKPERNGKTGAEKSAVPVSNPIGDLIKRVEP